MGKNLRQLERLNTCKTAMLILYKNKCFTLTELEIL